MGGGQSRIVRAEASPTHREGRPMDADHLKCKWIQFKRALKTRWGRFRDEHLVQSEGGYAKVVDKAHERLMKGADQRHQQSAPDAVGEVSH